MSDQIALIHSDQHGIPGNGGYLHWVRFTSYGGAMPINQMTAGGKFPSDDCAPSDILSRLRDDKRTMPMVLLEQFCGTNGQYGTSIPNLRTALTALGYANHFSASPPSGGVWVMNPAWGGLIPPSQIGPYISNTANVTITIDTPGAWEGVPPTEDSMSCTFVTPSGIQVVFYIDNNGHIQEMWFTGTWQGPLDVTTYYFNGFRSSGSLSGMCVPDGGRGTQAIFFRGTDGHMYEAWWNGAWNGPVPLPRT